MEYEIKPPSGTKLGLPELWEYRELFYFFTWRDIKVKYKQTVLGFLWAIIQPLIMMIIFTYLFGKPLNIPTKGVPYEIFVLSGLVMWFIFSTGISGAGNSMITNSNIIKKIYFPRLIVPVSAVLVTLFDFIFSFIVFLLIVFYFDYRYDLPIDYAMIFLMLIPSLLLVFIATTGIGTLLGALNVKYRDIRYVIPFLIQIAFFITPILFPMDIIKNEWAQYLLSINPMYGGIALFRSGITNEFPELNLLLISIISAVIFFLTGIFYFKKTEATFADIA